MTIPKRARYLAVFLVAVVLGAPIASSDGWYPEALGAWKPGLDRVHGGRPEQGVDWVRAKLLEQPDDICGNYFAALLHLDYDLGASDETERSELGRKYLERGLDRDAPDDDAAARYCQGAMYGLRAAERLEDGSYFGAAFDGKRMRSAMLDLLEEHPSFVDCKFWLGTYDYYAAVLPRYIKFFRALLFLPSGDRERGIAEIEEATRLGTFERYNAHWVLESVYAHEGKPLERRKVLRRFHAAYPDDLNAATTLARNLVESEPRDPERAFEVLHGLIEGLDGEEDEHARQRSGDLRYALAELYMRDVRYEPAASELREAMTVCEGDGARVLRYAVRRVSALNLAGLHDEALAVFRDMERRYPEADRSGLQRETFEFDADTSRLAAELIPAKRLAQHGKVDEASAAYERLLERHEGAAQIHFWLGELYFRERQWAEAESRYKKVAEMAPDMPAFIAPFTQLRLGQIFDATDRRSEAKERYRQARDRAGAYERYASAAEYFLENRYRADTP